MINIQLYNYNNYVQKNYEIWNILNRIYDWW